MGHLLDLSWQNKKKLAKGISNPRINKIYDIAKKEGAVGGKLTGAGGGGYMMLFCHKKYQPAVRKALEKQGLSLLDFKFDHKGAKTMLG